MKYLCLMIIFVVSLVAENLPEVVILATGGTIAGTHKDRSATVGYKAASLPIEDLLNSVPEIHNIAKIRGRQVFQIASENMDIEYWCTLAEIVRSEIAKPSVAGIVITHGTDTIEETAYFLNLVIDTHKPIVIVGSMRPATAYSADGPLNLLNAVHVASSMKARDFGVLVVMNDCILDARNVRKSHTTRVETFRSGNFGQIGTIISGDIHFYQAPLHRHTYKSIFNNISLSSDLYPNVEIAYCYAGTPAAMVDNMIERGAKGIVFACVGDGSLSIKFRACLPQWKKQAVLIRSTRIADGAVIRNGEVNDDECGTIPSDTLSPCKSRILLRLCLAKGLSFEQITQCFMEY